MKKGDRIDLYQITPEVIHNGLEIGLQYIQVEDYHGYVVVNPFTDCSTRLLFDKEIKKIGTFIIKELKDAQDKR